MWNPNAYRDTDYGLGDGDTFEPGAGWEEDYVPGAGESYIRTVLGPIRPDEVGVTLMQEFLQWMPAKLDARQTLADPQAMMTDLEAFFTASGRTIVAAGTTDSGRDASVLKTIAQHAPVNIVASTGWWDVGDAEQLRNVVEQEVAEGLDGTDVKPGVISVGMSSQSIEIAAAAAELRMATGLPAIVQADSPSTLEDVLESSVQLDGLVLGYPGMARLDIAAEIVRRDAYVLVSGLDGASADDQARAEMVADLVRHGHRDRILMSNGFRKRGLLNGYGAQPGLAFIVEQFAVMLLEAGIEALDVRGILVDNPARALSMIAPGSS